MSTFTQRTSRRRIHIVTAVSIVAGVFTYAAMASASTDPVVTASSRDVRPCMIEKMHERHHGADYGASMRERHHVAGYDTSMYERHHGAGYDTSMHERHHGSSRYITRASHADAVDQARSACQPR